MAVSRARGMCAVVLFDYRQSCARRRGRTAGCGRGATDRRTWRTAQPAGLVRASSARPEGDRDGAVPALRAGADHEVGTGGHRILEAANSPPAALSDRRCGSQALPPPPVGAHARLRATFDRSGRFSCSVRLSPCRRRPHSPEPRSVRIDLTDTLGDSPTHARQERRPRHGGPKSAAAGGCTEPGATCG